MKEIKTSNHRNDRRWSFLVEVFLVFCVFFLYEARPTPEPNEQHYLTKAKKIWNPDWAKGDLFLESGNAHLVFYLATGWLTKWLTLDQYAWTGRLFCWAMLAWAWTRLSGSLVPRPWFAPISAALFAGLIRYHKLAGEWVVGSFEAKMFAYTFVFLAIANLTQDRWNRAWILLGAATAFHVLVGGWAMIVAAGTWLVIGRQRALPSSMWPGIAVGLLLALVGLVPAFALNAGTDPEIIRQADWIHVYFRMPKHLHPLRFETERIIHHLPLVLTWIVLAILGIEEMRSKRLNVYVTGAVYISLIGSLIAWSTEDPSALQASLLRYYWFRFADAMVPVGVSLGAGVLWMRLCQTRPLFSKAWLSIVILVAAGHLGHNVWWNVNLPHARGFKSGSSDPAESRRIFDDWRDACHWIDEHTPREAKFLTSHRAQSFVWFSGRAEVASRKNVPQDAASTVRWWRRLARINGGEDPKQWARSLTMLDASHLLEVGKKYEADQLITESTPQLPLPLAYRNGSFAVYELSRP